MGELTRAGDLFPGGDLDKTAADLRGNIARLLAAVGEKGVCRGCGAEVWWVIHRNGKRAPYTTAGLNHFIDCAKAKDFRR